MQHYESLVRVSLYVLCKITKCCYDIKYCSYILCLAIYVLLFVVGYKTIAINTTLEEESTATSKKKKGQVKEAIPLPPSLQIKEVRC